MSGKKKATGLSSERALEAARLRWEWMRRQKEYRADFEVCAHWRAAGNPGSVESAARMTELFCMRWKITPGLLPDPRSSWEKLPLADQSRLYVGENPCSKAVFRSAAVLHEITEEGGKTYVDLVRGDFIVINARKAKSIKALMHEIQNQLAFLMLLSPELKARDCVRDDAGKRNWDLVLRAGDLAGQGMRNKEIAMRLFPGDFDNKRKSKETQEAHRRSAEVKAAKLVAEFKRLEDISFP